jgi:hypothetical protein
MIVHDLADVSLQVTYTYSFCGEPLRFPFLEWHGSPPGDGPFNIVSVCVPCCRKYSKGLRADLIQLEAIGELQKLCGPRTTLIRASSDIRELASEFTAKNRERRDRFIRRRAEIIGLHRK